MSPPSKKPRIYLAGPMVFYPNPGQIFEEMKAICEKHGLEGVSPADNQVGLEDDSPGKELNLKIVQADFTLMDQLDGGIFCLDEVRRSTEMDPGTALEIGYMKAQGKPLSGWITDARTYPEKVSSYFEGRLVKTESHGQGATSGETRDPDGVLVHSVGMFAHGMAQGAIELSGGGVHSDANWKNAFEKAAQSLARQFGLQPPAPPKKLSNPKNGM